MFARREFLSHSLFGQRHNKFEEEEEATFLFFCREEANDRLAPGQGGQM
jgi:hypothetical protein